MTKTSDKASESDDDVGMTTVTFRLANDAVEMIDDIRRGTPGLPSRAKVLRGIVESVLYGKGDDQAETVGDFDEADEARSVRAARAKASKGAG